LSRSFLELTFHTIKNKIPYKIFTDKNGIDHIMVCLGEIA